MDSARQPSLRGTLRVLTACNRAWPRHELEVADETPPMADRCRSCEAVRPVLVGLRELAACAIEVSFDCYERLAAASDAQGVTIEALASDAIERAIEEELATS